MERVKPIENQVLFKYCAGSRRFLVFFVRLFDKILLVVAKYEEKTSRKKPLFYKTQHEMEIDIKFRSEQ